MVCYVAGINKYQVDHVTTTQHDDLTAILKQELWIQDELVERDELKKYKVVLVQQLHLSLVDALVPEELRSGE